MVFDKVTTKAGYEALFNQKVGYVFSVVESDYETVMRRIDEYLPKNKKFKVTYIQGGTKLFTMYGSGHCVITENSAILV